MQQRQRFWILIWLVTFFPRIATSQNLIPNGSFENYRNCPRLDNLLQEATPWFNPNKTSPDFYHQCYPTPQMVLPPRTGEGLARLFWDLNWAEYLSVPLISPLEANECYYFEMYVSIESPNKYLTQTLGAHFSTQPLSANNTALFNVYPQVLDYQLTTSTKALQWELVSGYVRPKGGERYLTIGSFYQLPVFLGFQYLFFDDVSLLPIKVDLGKDQTLCGRESTLLLNAQTPGATSYLWNNGSTAPTLLVTKPGKYWVAATTSCKTVSDTISIKYALDFNLGKDTTLCHGQLLNLKSPTNGLLYRWQDGSTQNTYQVSKAGKYTLTTTQAGCTVTDSILVRYIQSPQLNLGQNKSLCFGETFMIQPAYAEGEFTWDDHFDQVERQVRKSGEFKASVKNACATVKDSVVIQYQSCGCNIYAPDIFTPNADYHNDTFRPLAGCSDITITSLSIFDRWGEVIFQTDMPPFEWNGQVQGDICPPNTYAWTIRYELNQKGQISLQQKQGVLSLIR